MMSRRKYLGGAVGALASISGCIGGKEGQPVPEYHIVSEDPGMLAGVSVPSYSRRTILDTTAELIIDLGRTHGAGYVEVTGDVVDEKAVVPVSSEDVSVGPVELESASDDGVIRALVTAKDEKKGSGQAVVIIDPDGEWR